jgi:outer membrane protein TolC
MKKKLLLLFYLTFTIASLYSQTKKLDLFQCIKYAADSSLHAFQAKNSYLSSYWGYRSFLIGRLPKINLNVSPFQYNHSITQRYDYNENIDVYRNQQSLSSSAGVSISQLIGITGGTITANSDLNYLLNMGESDFSQYSTTPFRIGYTQSLFGFNSYKWEKKQEPLKYQQAKKQFLYEVENISEEVIQLFFALALVQKENDLATENLLTSDTLYQVGLERQRISTISQAEILTLELDMINAQNTLKSIELELKTVRFNLASYLKMGDDIELLLPELLVTILINKENALLYARENNPDFIKNQQSLLDVEKEIESMKKNNSVTMGISAGIGFNQAASTFKEAYINPSQQNYLSLSLSIPVFDWGINKGKLSLAKNNLNITKASIEQNEKELRQNILSAIDHFNLQCELIQSAQRALKLSKEAYDNTKQRFVIGKTNVNDITLSQNRYKEAQRNYINILKQYWLAYYKIRKLTLYDFVRNEDLSSQFEGNIKSYYFQ